MMDMSNEYILLVMINAKHAELERGNHYGSDGFLHISHLRKQMPIFYVSDRIASLSRLIGR